MGKCIIKKETYCCYDSVLSKTLQVESRKQLHKSFGDANNPSCGGFTLDEIERIDFNKIDFSEFFDKEVAPKMTNIKGDELEDRSKRKAEELMRENNIGGSTQ
jgi:conjugal transfer mating pair stabilization protein TraN